MKKFFVTGIGTDVGKTIAAAVLVEALEADYWKPVQAGSLDHTDADTVKSLVSNQKTVFHPEAYRLQLPASPHAAAAAEGIIIDPARILIPDTANHLVIEGAGGIMVPLNPSFLVLDLLVAWQMETVLVSRNYLGSINHTLLTVEALQRRQVPIAGIIFNGDPNPATEEVILSLTRLRRLPSLQQEQTLTREVIRGYGGEFRGALMNG
jgi:dethiobiotin synthetase